MSTALYIVINAVPDAGIIIIGVREAFFGGLPFGWIAVGGPNPGREFCFSRDTGGGTGWFRLRKSTGEFTLLGWEENESLILPPVLLRFPPRILLKEVPWKDKFVSIWKSVSGWSAWKTSWSYRLYPTAWRLFRCWRAWTFDFPFACGGFCLF